MEEKKKSFGREDVFNPIWIVSPKEGTTENSNENEYFDFRPL